MKFRIKQIGAAVTLPDEAISFPWKDGDGVTHTIELHKDAQVQLMLPLLASGPVQEKAAPRRFFQPMAAKVFRSNTGGAGVSFFLQPQIAIHVSLHPDVLADLRRQLDELAKSGGAKH